MARRYDSSRRRDAGADPPSALKLHWEGITEYEPLAQSAGCSLPTLRKHFPTKEEFYLDCTQTFAASLLMPDLTALRGVAPATRRIEESVSEFCRIHEAMFGYAWTVARLHEESSTLHAELKNYEGLADLIAEIIAPEDGSKAALIRGLLDFLTYRALRLSAGLSAAEVRDQLMATIGPLAAGGDSATHPPIHPSTHTEDERS